MIKEDKYYVPDLEEFHIGFEYEWMREGEGATPWTKSSLTFNNGPVGDEDAWRNNDYRVKYLDREDIESLGWEYKKNGEDFDTFKISAPDVDSILVYRYSNKTLHVFFRGVTVFAGGCKNKNELKKLMKQLYID